MNSTTEIETPCVVICHFANEELVEQAGGRLIRYQVTIDPNNEQQLSPSADFIRFGNVEGDEITGWQPCMNMVIDEVLFEYEIVKGTIEHAPPDYRREDHYEIPYHDRVKVA